LCKSLHTLGATIYALDVNPDALADLGKECPGVKSICVDLLDWNATRAALENHLPDIMHGLVNNAGIGVDGTFMKIQPDGFDKVIGVNVKAIVNVTQVVAQRMINGGTGGSIVNMSSLVF